jgi:dimethylargininase
MFKHAIVRPPGWNFAEGLTSSPLGAPDLALTLRQHDAYCRALERCGLALTCLTPDEQHPDSTFVEDTAIITRHGAILTRPGAASREGEVAAIRPALAKFFSEFREIVSPGTVDGGDICEAGDHFFIGVSARTNAAGAKQLAGFLSASGFTSSEVDIHGISSILHLKSGLTWLGGRRLAAIGALADHPAFKGFDIVPVATEEEYAANCIRVNDFVLMPEGFPQLRAALERAGDQVIPLAMSEFQKMDGGLSCLSLRF